MISFACPIDVGLGFVVENGLEILVNGNRAIDVELEVFDVHKVAILDVDASAGQSDFSAEIENDGKSLSF